MHAMRVGSASAPTSSFFAGVAHGGGQHHGSPAPPFLRLLHASCGWARMRSSSDVAFLLIPPRGITQRRSASTQPSPACLRLHRPGAHLTSQPLRRGVGSCWARQAVCRSRRRPTARHAVEHTRCGVGSRSPPSSPRGSAHTSRVISRSWLGSGSPTHA